MAKVPQSARTALDVPSLRYQSPGSVQSSNKLFVGLVGCVARAKEAPDSLAGTRGIEEG